MGNALAQVRPQGPSATEGSLWQLVVMNDKIDEVLEYKQFKLLSIEDSSPSYEGTLVRHRNDIIQLEVRKTAAVAEVDELGGVEGVLPAVHGPLAEDLALHHRRLVSGLLCLALMLGLLPSGIILPAQAHWADPYGQKLVEWGVMRGDISGKRSRSARPPSRPRR